MYSFLSIGWGLLSDIDIESEKLRAIGGQRFTVWSLARLIGKILVYSPLLLSLFIELLNIKFLFQGCVRTKEEYLTYCILILRAQCQQVMLVEQC